MNRTQYLTHGLCPACFYVDYGNPHLSFARSVADIVAGCKMGCTFCGLLTYSLDLKSRVAKDADYSNTDVSLARHDADRDPENSGWPITALYCRTGRKTAIFDITILRGQRENSEEVLASMAPETPTPRFERPESILDRSFNWVRKQLLECTASHNCGSMSEMPLPTRILDIGGHEEPRIRLVVPDEGTTGKYAALSYCWGGSNNFVLTEETFKDLTIGFKPSQLPQTLQDAVRVTREIGLRYLWVDALCIIQGQSGEAINDWNIEVAKMDTVYKNAFVTISAAAAPDASAGLFSGSHCDLPFVSNGADWGQRKVTLWARATWLNDTPAFKSEPINSRAWTFQENIFSNRVLFYTSFGLLWQCERELIYVYSGQSRARGHTGRSEARSQQDHIFDINISRYMMYVARNGLLRSWQDILEMYTARNLTNPYDKLPALAAIAQKYSGSKDAEYLAGLWKSTFRQGLLWRHHPGYMSFAVGASDAGNPLRSNGYRAPSWSWAALDGMVQSEGVESTPIHDTWLAEVTTYPTPILVNPRNPFGGVVKMSTELQMRGAVEIFKVHEYPKTNKLVGIWPVKGGSDTGRLWVDDCTETAAWRGRETEPLFCLHILGITDQQSPDSPRRIKLSYALALLQVRGLDRTYIRIGFADIKPEPSWPSSGPQNMAVETVTIL